MRLFFFDTNRKYLLLLQVYGGSLVNTEGKSVRLAYRQCLIFVFVLYNEDLMSSTLITYKLIFVESLDVKIHCSKKVTWS